MSERRGCTMSIQPFLIIFAGLACAGAVWRMLDASATTRIDETTLLYLGVAGALLLLKDVKSLAFGSYKVEFERKLEELESKVENAQAAAFSGRGVARSAQPVAAEEEGARNVQPQGVMGFVPMAGKVHDDPWKGVFGGQHISGNREISADVTPAGATGLFRVRLTVQSTNPKRDPLQGAVQFFLHSTFPNDRPIVTVSPSGVAELILTAWGAFTVGALTDAGQRKLELDLAELATAPAEFKAR